MRQAAQLWDANEALRPRDQSLAAVLDTIESVPNYLKDPFVIAGLPGEATKGAWQFAQAVEDDPKAFGLKAVRCEHLGLVPPGAIVAIRPGVGTHPVYGDIKIASQKSSFPQGLSPNDVKVFIPDPQR